MTVWVVLPFFAPLVYGAPVAVFNTHDKAVEYAQENSGHEKCYDYLDVYMIEVQ